MLPVVAGEEKARQIAEDIAWMAVERDWTADSPLVIDETDVVVSITPWEDLQPVDPRRE
jgi:hypothetical protein